MADLLPSFARKREVTNFAPQTKALEAVRKAIVGMGDEERDRFHCLVADVARTLAWAAGRRDWLSLLEEVTRQQGEDYSIAVRKMNLAESLESALWVSMRAHPNPLYRLALGLVTIRLRLGIAWVERSVLAARDFAGALILDAFEVAELSPSALAAPSPEDFRVGEWPAIGELFAAVREPVFSRAMDRHGVLTEAIATNMALRDAFAIDPAAGGRQASPCFDVPLRNTKETGPKGALCEAGKLFNAEIAAETLTRLGSAPDARELVSVPQALTIASELWGDRLEAGAAEMIGAEAARELRRRCHATLAYGRATTAAFVLMVMIAESRWLALAGPATGSDAAIEPILDLGGSWPAVIPPKGVTVRAVDETEEPKEKAILRRNEWNGREFKWYWAALVILLMLYGWAAQVGLL